MLGWGFLKILICIFFLFFLNSRQQMYIWTNTYKTNFYFILFLFLSFELKFWYCDSVVVVHRCSYLPVMAIEVVATGMMFST
jgi:hypothetical protein